jgi:hypothetical protein
MFDLTDATQWLVTYNGFGFYNFIVNYFEEKDDAASVKQIEKLLTWCNQ